MTTVHATNPDLPCPHKNFVATVKVNRLTSNINGSTIAYNANIQVHCTQCDEPFRWIGAPAGLRPDRPCASIDETELRAPLRPPNSDPDFGLGIPGFALRWVEGGT